MPPRQKNADLEHISKRYSTGSQSTHKEKVDRLFALSRYPGLSSSDLETSLSSIASDTCSDVSSSGSSCDALPSRDLKQPLVQDEQNENPCTPHEQVLPEADEHVRRGTIPAVQDAQELRNLVLDRRKPKPLDRLEGWVEKHSPKWLRGWQKRWFVLENKRLCWGSAEGFTSPLGILDFDLVKIEIEAMWDQGDDKRCRGHCASILRSSSNCFRIHVVGGDRIFALRTATRSEAKHWITKLQAHTRASPRMEVGLSKAQRKFWKFDRISPEKFAELADTGDLLLFQSTTRVAAVQRTITGGQYDHVALLLRFANGKLVVLEATGTAGVSLVAWSDFVKHSWYKLYPRIVHRRVQFSKTKETMQHFEQFVRTVVGKPYDISLAKLRQKTSIPDNVDRKGYFCSEVVAKALMELGVLQADRSSAQYWPTTFSLENLPVCPNASIGPELLIDFETFGVGAPIKDRRVSPRARLESTNY